MAISVVIGMKVRASSAKMIIPIRSLVRLSRNCFVTPLSMSSLLVGVPSTI